MALNLYLGGYLEDSQQNTHSAIHLRSYYAVEYEVISPHEFTSKLEDGFPWQDLMKGSPRPEGETVMEAGDWHGLMNHGQQHVEPVSTCEVAAFMVAQGAKVVAVNAASAYQALGTV